jgi:hypothetical protein
MVKKYRKNEGLISKQENIGTELCIFDLTLDSLIIKAAKGSEYPLNLQY